MPHTEYHPFKPWRKLAEYRGQPGPHNGQALDANAYQALADATAKGGPPMMAVRGEWVRGDGVRFLDFIVTREWFEWRRDRAI